MYSFQMPKKTAFSIESTNTQITSKRLFSSVAQNVLSDKRWRFHFFRTKWTSPQMFSKLNGIILQFQSIRWTLENSELTKFCSFISNHIEDAYNSCDFSNENFVDKYSYKVYNHMVFLQYVLKCVSERDLEPWTF